MSIVRKPRPFFCIPTSCLSISDGLSLIELRILAKLDALQGETEKPCNIFDISSFCLKYEYKLSDVNAAIETLVSKNIVSLTMEISVL